MTGGSGKAPQLGGARSAIVVVWLLGCIAALLYTYPLVWHVGEGIPYGAGVTREREVVGLVPGDHLQFYYFLSITDDMVRGRVPLFRDPYEFSVPEPNPRLTFFFLPFSLLFAAVAPLGGTLAYNLLVWLSFPATALPVFLLGRRLGLDVLAAILAAAGATLLPYRVANLAGGHPTGFVTFLLPLTFFFLERAWQERSRTAAAGAGLSVATLAVNEPHLLYFFALLFAPWMLWALWRSEPTRAATERVRSAAIVLLAAFGPAVSYASYISRHEGIPWSAAVFAVQGAWLVGLLWIAWRITAEIRARAGEAAWVEEAASYLPLLLLALYPVQVVADLPYLGRGLFAVTVTWLLVRKRPVFRALLSLARCPSARSSASRALALWPFVVGVVAAVLLVLHYKMGALEASATSQGRTLRDVMLFSPRPAEFLFRTNPSFARLIYPGVILPALALIGCLTTSGRAMTGLAILFGSLSLGVRSGQWLLLYRTAFAALPYFNMIRQPGKFFVVAGLALALAAGFGAAEIRSRLGFRAGTAVVVASLLLVLVDFSSVLPFGVSRLPEKNAAYEVVATHGGGSNLLEIPIWPGDSAFSSLYQYWALRTRVPTVNGYSPTAPRNYVEEIARPLESMNLGELSAEQYALLDRLRVRFVTLHRDAFPPQVSAYPFRFTLAAMRSNPNLRALGEDGGVYLFERVGGYQSWQPVVGSRLGIFFEAESLKLGTGVRVADESCSGGAFVRGGTGVSDRFPVVYGPNRPFPRGRYRARFRVRGRGMIEVTSNHGRRELARDHVGVESFHEMPLDFSLDGPATLEFRGWAGEGRTLDLDWVLVRNLDPVSGPRLRFEAEDLLNRSGTVREEADASGGAVSGIAPQAAPPGAVVFEGPYRLYGPGKLNVAVRARGGGFRLSIESADQRRHFGEIVLDPQPTWQVAESSVEIPRREILCVRVISTGADAEIDYVEMRRGS